jgi:hypothetical protein
MSTATITDSSAIYHCDYSELENVGSLTPHPRNPNKHPDKQVAMLAKSIRRLGWRSPIIVSSRSNFIVAGEGRYQAAQLLELAEVPVDFQEFGSDEEEIAFLIADNKLAELSVIEESTLQGLVDDIGDTVDLEAIGFDPEEIAPMEGEEDAPRAARDFAPSIQFNIVFENEEQQQGWFTLLRHIRAAAPSAETAAEAIHQYAKALSNGETN